MQTKNKTIRAFTLVEMLTTVAIIGILLAVLIPALSRVGQSARVVRQRAQFQTLEIALETFRNDTGDYPPSAYDDSAEYAGYTASHRLAEAIVGRDGFGFHPDSGYRADGLGPMNPEDPRIYYPAFQDYLNLLSPEEQEQARQKNLSARKGPYLELESANAVRLSSLFPNMDPTLLVDSFVLADSFRTRRHAMTGRKTGMPILYYRANRTRVGHDAANEPTDNTYNFLDSYHMLWVLGLDNITPQWFYPRTQNPNFTYPPRPYRAESFILHSAGPDGVFGTADDVFNFEEAN